MLAAVGDHLVDAHPRFIDWADQRKCCRFSGGGSGFNFGLRCRCFIGGFRFGLRWCRGGAAPPRAAAIMSATDIFERSTFAVPPLAGFSAAGFSAFASAGFAAGWSPPDFSPPDFSPPSQAENGRGRLLFLGSAAVGLPCHFEWREFLLRLPELPSLPSAF